MRKPTHPKPSEPAPTEPKPAEPAPPPPPPGVGPNLPAIPAFMQQHHETARALGLDLSGLSLERIAAYLKFIADLLAHFPSARTPVA